MLHQRRPMKKMLDWETLKDKGKREADKRKAELKEGGEKRNGEELD